MADQRPPSVRAAVTRFLLAGFVTMLVLGAASAWALARVARTEAVNDAKQLSELVGKSVVEPSLEEGLLRGDPRALDRMDRVVRRRVLSRDFLRVKIWRGDGRILYSDRRELIGSRYTLGADDLESLKEGGVDAGVSDLSRPENRFERGHGKLLEVYLPIKTRSGEPLLFETYLRFSEVTATGRDLWKSFVPALIGALIVLELAQVPLALSLARRLERSHAEREALLQRSLQASELERRRIAADLHDGTVQDLVGATYALSAARERMAADGGSVEEIERAEATCRTAIRQLRTLLVEIYPPRLGEAGLGSALEDLVAPLDGKGIAATVDAPPDLRLPEQLTALLYRIAREAVRNAAEHGEPEHIGIEVARRDGRASLSVSDDGSGFDPGEGKTGHFGLRLVSDQVRDLGGTLDIDSAPDKGTLLHVEVPVE